MQLIEDLERAEKRMQELEESGQLFPTDYHEDLSGSESEPVSEDSLLME